ncbi:hypothetical protein Tco_1124306 [Tanacetum coccineum]|uniref:Uncharacterized protein n=1 Tax=Tanacetum coccineum TaxID=301880 RepID=A0ABQ5J6E6_9ASTR
MLFVGLEGEGQEMVGGELTEGDVNAGDLVFSQLENEARDAVRESSFPLWSFSLYDPFPSASVTLYGPSHLGPSFLVSSAWLASLLRYSKSPGLKLVFRTLAL